MSKHLLSVVKKWAGKITIIFIYYQYTVMIFRKIFARFLYYIAQAKRLSCWKTKSPHVALTIQERIEDKIDIIQIPKNGRDEAENVIEIELKIINFTDTIELRKHRYKNIIFRKCIFSQELIENYSFHNCSFIECYFNGSRIVSTEFHKCHFEECYFYKAKFISTYIDPLSFSFSWEWHWYKANVNAGLFQELYKNAKDTHQDTFAMHADKRFRYYKRYEYLRGKNPNPWKFLIGAAYHYLLGYGYGIINTLILTIILALTFACMIKDYLKGATSFFEAFYFSVVSLTTVGYGEITVQHEIYPLALTMLFMLASVAWCAVVTAIIVKRIIK